MNKLKYHVLLSRLRLLKWVEAQTFRLRAKRGQFYRVRYIYALPNVTFPPVVRWTRHAPSPPEIGSPRPDGPGVLVEWHVETRHG